jgi:hypothetical protein
MKTIPVSIRLAARLPLSRSDVYTDPPKPNGESLAIAIAYFSSFYVATIFIVGETFSKNPQSNRSAGVMLATIAF